MRVVVNARIDGHGYQEAVVDAFRAVETGEEVTAEMAERWEEELRKVAPDAVIKFYPPRGGEPPTVGVFPEGLPAHLVKWEQMAEMDFGDLLEPKA